MRDTDHRRKWADSVRDIIRAVCKCHRTGGNNHKHGEDTFHGMKMLFLFRLGVRLNSLYRDHTDQCNYDRNTCSEHIAISKTDFQTDMAEPFKDRYQRNSECSEKYINRHVAFRAGERIVLAGIGLGVMGSVDLKTFLADKRVQVVAVCDVKNQNLAKSKGLVDGKYGNKDCKAYVDYREVLARDDIDMVLCATPDHWHAQVCIDAMKAGKDVYCEKPLTLTIREGRKVVGVARRYGRVLSCGSQRVIGDFGRFACAARSGRFGKILAVHADPGPPSRLCSLPGQQIPPDTIDWDRWLGPAPWVPYHPNRCASGVQDGSGFRSWYDYTGGMMTDWGGHKFGGALHGMGLDHTGPVEIIPPDGQDVKNLTFVFANGMKLYAGPGKPYIKDWEEYKRVAYSPMRYVCEDGEAKPRRSQKVPPGLRWYEGRARHPIDDFINCVQTRRRPFRDVEYAHRTATVCHLGNIGFKLKRKLRWDPDREDFVGDAEASRLLDRPRRGAWQI